MSSIFSDDKPVVRTMKVRKRPNSVLVIVFFFLAVVLAFCLLRESLLGVKFKETARRIFGIGGETYIEVINLAR